MNAKEKKETINRVMHLLRSGKISTSTPNKDVWKFFEFEENNGWISVEEKLPEECELVYAIREGNVEPGIYKFMAKDQWEWAPRFIACLDDISHWMQLPKPPKKGGKK